MPVVHSSESVQYAVRIMFDARHGVSYQYPIYYVVLLTVFCVATMSIAARKCCPLCGEQSGHLRVIIASVFSYKELWKHETGVVTLWLCADPAPLRAQLTV